MTLPNFLIIGAAKSGTSALYGYLWQHPDIYMSSNKEPNFFALEGQKACFAGPGDETINMKSVTELASYEALFAGVKNEKAIGEASNLYLYHPEAAERIKVYIPYVRLIAILRNPADRAFSSYLHMTRDGREPMKSFAEALAEEPIRIRANWAHIWYYQQLGYYYEQLERYFILFPRQQIAVYTYDEFSTDPQKVLRNIFQFLGLDSTFEADVSLRYNVSGHPRFGALQKLLVRPTPAKERLKFLLPAYTRKHLINRLLALNMRGTAKSVMDPSIRRQLLNAYRDDIFKLQFLIDKDLSCWLA
jgi:hypothetical protein